MPPEALSPQHATAAPQVGLPRILSFHDFASGRRRSYGVTMRLSAASAARRCIAQFFQRPRNALAAPFSREVIRAEALRTI
jgi:hypothetical protein